LSLAFIASLFLHPSVREDRSKHTFAGTPEPRFQNRRRTLTVDREARHTRRYIIGALIVAVGVLGYNLYQTRKEPEGLQINVGPNGLKIQNK
jgi:hypothetical protein